MSKKIIISIILILLIIAGGVFWWWQSGKETKELGAEVQIEVKTNEEQTTVELKDGAKIILPAGSAAVGTIVTVRSLDPAISPELPEWATRAILLYEIDIDQSLQNPATIQIPLPKNDELSLLGHYHDGFWEITPFTVKEGTALIEVEHLSIFGWLDADEGWFISFLESVGPPSGQALEATFGNVIKAKKWVGKKLEESIHWLSGGKADELYHKVSVAVKLIKAMTGDSLAYTELLESGELDRMRESLGSSEDSRYETRFLEWLMEGGPKRKDSWRVSDLNQIRVALELYREDHGSYPNSLSDLTSGYWIALEDPITGHPYAYTSCVFQGRNCYTLGANLVSNHTSLQTDVDVAICSLSGQNPPDCSDANFHYCVKNCVEIKTSKEQQQKEEVKEKSELLEKGDPAALVPPKTTEEKPKEEKLMTEIIWYVPKERPDKVYEGYCWINSVAAMFRKDAWRCAVEDHIYDPCFVFESNKSLVCNPFYPTIGDKGILLKLTKPLPKPNIPKDRFGEGWGWLIEFEDGTTCSPYTGTAPLFNDQRINYGCGSEKYRGILELQAEGLTWKAEVVVVKDGKESIELIPLKRVWQ